MSSRTFVAKIAFLCYEIQACQTGSRMDRLVRRTSFEQLTPNFGPTLLLGTRSVYVLILYLMQLYIVELQRCDRVFDRRVESSKTEEPISWFTLGTNLFECWLLDVNDKFASILSRRPPSLSVYLQLWSRIGSRTL